MGDKAKRLLAKAFGQAEAGMPDLPDRMGRSWRRLEARGAVGGLHAETETSPWHKYRRYWKVRRHGGLACWRAGWESQA